MSDSESVIKTDKVMYRCSFRREVFYTHLHVFYLSVDSSSSQVPSIAAATSFALSEIERIRERLMSEGKIIDWAKLSSMSPFQFGVPSFLSCGARVATSMSLSPDVSEMLDKFIEDITPDFTSLKKRRPYRPYSVALLLRAVIANELGKLPTKDEDQDL